ncbi:MAG: TerB family tellurite resistance protein [Bacteroidota bacterium]
MFKWILSIGAYFLLGRSIGGAIVGFVIGSGIDNYQQILAKNGGKDSKFFSSEDVFNHYQQRSGVNDFVTMLMALSAGVMKADGKVLKAELDFVKAFFGQQFGAQFTADHLQTLKKFIDAQSIPIDQICNDIRMRMAPEVRVHLLHYLFGIAKADGHVSDVEMNVIQSIAMKLGIHQSDFDSVKSMFYRDTNSDYTVLGVQPSATDDEIKKAYRQMAIKFHPDKVAQMGEEFQKGAKEKFQSIQDSYDALKKQRGFK